MTVDGYLSWGNYDFNSGNEHGARGSYQEALNTLRKKDGCYSCIRALEKAFDQL